MTAGIHVRTYSMDFFRDIRSGELALDTSSDILPFVFYWAGSKLREPREVRLMRRFRPLFAGRLRGIRSSSLPRLLNGPSRKFSFRRLFHELLLRRPEF